MQEKSYNEWSGSLNGRSAMELRESAKQSFASMVAKLIGNEDPLQKPYAINAMLHYIENAIDSITIRERRSDALYQGEIAIRLYSEREMVTAEVEDNGVGIDTQIEPFLFQKLNDTPVPTDVRKSIDDELLGCQGYGLATAKEKMNKIGGDVFYQNKGENEGAVFGITFPLQM